MSEGLGPLLAEGRKVKLADGSERSLQFRNKSVLAIEKRFHGISRYAETLRQYTLETVAYTFGLLFHVNAEEALDLVDLKQTSRYLDAISDSLAEALGLEYENCQACGKTLSLTDAKFCPYCGVGLPEKGEAKSQGTDGHSPGEDSSTQPWSSLASSRGPSGTT